VPKSTDESQHTTAPEPIWRLHITKNTHN